MRANPMIGGGLGGDKSTTVRCQCGTNMATLAPGERIARSGHTEIRTVRCPGCGKERHLRIARETRQ